MPNLCIICLNFRPDLKSVNEIASNQLQIVQKLRKCVPEVEWKTDSEVCFPCLNQLENVYSFREMCIQSYLIRKNDEMCAKSEPDEKAIPDDDDGWEFFGNDRSDSEAEPAPPPPSEGELVCFHCEGKFKSKVVLERHMRSEHTKKKSKISVCDVCNKTLSSESALKRHKNICKKKEPKSEDQTYNICDVCGATFTNKYLLKRHLKNVHATEKKFKCELCDRKFASPVYLNAHKRYHSGERRHICSFCGKGYITASDLYHHEKIHADKRAYRCLICPKAFNTSSDLHKHKICVHLDRSLWKYECSFCQRRFPLKTNLDTHTKTHTGERNFLCHLCERKCINRSVLKRHIESHSIAKTFKCELCLQGYKYQKSLDIHMVKVHGIGEAKIPLRVKKYFCSMCPKSYFANNKLQKHIRSHTGERPFGCPACDKCFIDKSYIKQHLKTAHNVF